MNAKCGIKQDGKACGEPAIGSFLGTGMCGTHMKKWQEKRTGIEASFWNALRDKGLIR